MLNEMQYIEGELDDEESWGPARADRGDRLGYVKTRIGCGKINAEKSENPIQIFLGSDFSILVENINFLGPEERFLGSES